MRYLSEFIVSELEQFMNQHDTHVPNFEKVLEEDPEPIFGSDKEELLDKVAEILENVDTVDADFSFTPKKVVDAFNKFLSEKGVVIQLEEERTQGITEIVYGLERKNLEQNIENAISFAIERDNFIELD